jgi:hypothetical protein
MCKARLQHVQVDNRDHTKSPFKPHEEQVLACAPDGLIAAARLL